MPLQIGLLTETVITKRALKEKKERKGISFSPQSDCERAASRLTLKGFSLLWMFRTCRCRLDEMEKDRSQYLHLYGCSPVCVRRWRVRLADRGKALPQNLHEYRLLPPAGLLPLHGFDDDDRLAAGSDDVADDAFCSDGQGNMCGGGGGIGGANAAGVMG